jgi:hypothetical protein
MANTFFVVLVPQLHKELNPRELQQFAQILRDMENRFPEFCEKVLRLYGTERMHLLKGHALCWSVFISGSLYVCCFFFVLSFYACYPIYKTSSCKHSTFCSHSFSLTR